MHEEGAFRCTYEHSNISIFPRGTHAREILRGKALARFSYHYPKNEVVQSGESSHVIMCVFA